MHASEDQTITKFTCPQCYRPRVHPRDREKRFCAVCALEEEARMVATLRVLRAVQNARADLWDVAGQSPLLMPPQSKLFADARASLERLVTALGGSTGVRGPDTSPSGRCRAEAGVSD